MFVWLGERALINVGDLQLLRRGRDVVSLTLRDRDGPIEVPVDDVEWEGFRRTLAEIARAGVGPGIVGGGAATAPAVTGLIDD